MVYLSLCARQLSRSAIGIEISPDYAKLIKRRLVWGFEPDIEWRIEMAKNTGINEFER